MIINRIDVNHWPLPVVENIARNKLNRTRALLEMISTIEIQNTPRSGPGKYLTLVGYSSSLPKIHWIQAIYIIVANIPHHYSPSSDRALFFSVYCVGVIKMECRQMVMLLGAVCWCRENTSLPTKCTLFHLLHQTKAQILIQCHDNNIWKRMYIKNLSYSIETYLQYNVQRGK